MDKTQNKAGSRAITVEEVRRYVGASIVGGPFLPLIGGTLTGNLFINSGKLGIGTATVPHGGVGGGYNCNRRSKHFYSRTTFTSYNSFG